MTTRQTLEATHGERWSSTTTGAGRSVSANCSCPESRTASNWTGTSLAPVPKTLKWNGIRCFDNARRPCALSYVNHANMGDYREAVERFERGGHPVPAQAYGQSDVTVVARSRLTRVCSVTEEMQHARIDPPFLAVA